MIGFINGCQMSGIVLLAFVYSQLCIVAGQNNWGYKSGESFKDPKTWKNIDGSSCGGSKQSPIDIQSEFVEFSPDLFPVNVHQISNANSKVKLTKEARCLKLDFNNKWQITFGDSKCLRPLSIHWHWGANNKVGSEHKVNGETFPMEGHLVSYNCELYNDPKTALSSPNGLYVIGFFYKIGENSEPIESILKHIEEMGEDNFLKINEIGPSAFLPLNLKDYYRYDGSLTTPPCTENVIWTLMDEVLTIGKSQMDIFRSLKFGKPEHGPLVNNFRPLNPINNREVYSSFDEESDF